MENEIEQLRATVSRLERELGEARRDNKILAINGNNDEARCVEIGMLTEERDAALKELGEARERRLKCGHPGTYGFGDYCAVCERDAALKELGREHDRHVDADAKLAVALRERDEAWKEIGDLRRNVSAALQGAAPSEGGTSNG